jgi:hypothetical protein
MINKSKRERVMFPTEKKVYLITYYDVFYESYFIKTYPLNSDLTVYVFRTSAGDIHLRMKADYKQNMNYLTYNFDELKLEIARRKLRYGVDIKRTPIPVSKLLKWAMYHYPDKLL